MVSALQLGCHFLPQLWWMQLPRTHISGVASDPATDTGAVMLSSVRLFECPAAVYLPRPVYTHCTGLLHHWDLRGAATWAVLCLRSQEALWPLQVHQELHPTSMQSDTAVGVSNMLWQERRCRTVKIFTYTVTHFSLLAKFYETQEPTV